MFSSKERSRNAEFVLPFGAIDHATLPFTGGKAANLGELARAGLPVSPGFCVTTAAYDLVGHPGCRRRAEHHGAHHHGPTDYCRGLRWDDILRE